MKLNQVIAISNGEKSKAQKAITKIYQELKKENLFEGITRRYTPKFEDGDIYPNEDKQVQKTIPNIIAAIKTVMSELFDIVATQDVGNCKAKANIEIDGNIIVSDVPVTYLLFLEKQIIDLRTIVSDFPVLDPAEEWTYKKESGVYKSEPKENFKTKKVPKNHILYEATKEHPAQVQVFTEDVVDGTWEVTKFSGNITHDKKDEILKRIDSFIKAIRFAKEEGNSIEVKRANIGDSIMDYLFE